MERQRPGVLDGDVVGHRVPILRQLVTCLVNRELTHAEATGDEVVQASIDRVRDAGRDHETGEARDLAPEEVCYVNASLDEGARQKIGARRSASGEVELVGPRRRNRSADVHSRARICAFADQRAVRVRVRRNQHRSAALPLVDRHICDLAASSEVRENQNVAVLVSAGEDAFFVGILNHPVPVFVDFDWSHRVLEQPKADLSVAVVVEAIGAPVDIEMRVFALQPGIRGCEAVLEVGLGGRGLEFPVPAVPFRIAR